MPCHLNLFAFDVKILLPTLNFGEEGGELKHLINLLDSGPLAVKLIGGSIISKYGLKNPDKSLGAHLRKLNKSIYIKREQSIGGLTFSQSIPIIEELNNSDVLVLYFGTSVGWPRISRKMEGHLRPELLESTSFHLPVYSSKKFTNRVKAKIRHLERNALKIILFPFGLYRPRNSLEDLPNLITAIEHLAERKSHLIIWVQHNSLGYRRLWLERKVYGRYYSEILKSLENFRSPHFRVLTPDNNFLIQENYLLDGVHLSEIGHQRMANLIYAEIQTALAEARDYMAENGK